MYHKGMYSRTSVGICRVCKDTTCWCVKRYFVRVCIHVAINVTQATESRPATLLSIRRSSKHSFSIPFHHLRIGIDHCRKVSSGKTFSKFDKNKILVFPVVIFGKFIFYFENLIRNLIRKIVRKGKRFQMFLLGLYLFKFKLLNFLN